MKDHEGVAFLQWCLPKLELRWSGYRKVRRQVYKRLAGRLAELNLPDTEAYRHYLMLHAEEWAILDRLCWIPISRFYRDRAVFEFLESDLLPRLAGRLAAADEHELRCWSIGCAAGEEPYTLAILWKEALAGRFPTVRLRILATDSDARALDRARLSWYPPGSVKDLPDSWRTAAFERRHDGYWLKPEYREPVSFQLEDIRQTNPTESFHLILCRYLICTYFEENLQRRLLERIAAALLPGGAFVIGGTETWIEGAGGLTPLNVKLGVYHKPLVQKPLMPPDAAATRARDGPAEPHVVEKEEPGD
ncbi:CheR family methyltransferase [Candidatus Nitrospira bockiana]